MTSLTKLEQLTFALGRCDFSGVSIGDKAIVGALLEHAQELQERYNNRTPTEWAYAQACTALDKHRERADKAESDHDNVIAQSDELYKRLMVAEAERDALAAENLALKELAEGYIELVKVGVTCESDCWARLYKEFNKTPVTDAYANQLRAEGVEILAKGISRDRCHDRESQMEMGEVLDFAIEFAAHLREENGNG